MSESSPGTPGYNTWAEEPDLGALFERLPESAVFQGMNIQPEEWEHAQRRLGQLLGTSHFTAAEEWLRNDLELRAHSAEVALLAGIITGRAGGSDEDQRAAMEAGWWHDTGKVDTVIHAAIKGDGPLTHIARKIMANHALLSGQRAREAAVPEQVARAVEEHHAHIKDDVNGGPYGRVPSSGERGNKHWMYAAAVAAADTYSATYGTRNYQNGHALTPQQRAVIIQQQLDLPPPIARAAQSLAIV